MAKFTQLEKERIKKKLLEVAYRFFIDKGLKSTSLEDITSSVGIAKSTFMHFSNQKKCYIWNC